MAGHKFSSPSSRGSVRGSPQHPPGGALRARSSRAPRTQNPHYPLKSRPRRGLGRSPGRKGTPGHPGSRVLPLGSISVDPSPHAAGPARGEGEQSCGETMLTSYQRGSQVPTVGRRGEPGQLLPTPWQPAPACACSAPRGCRSWGGSSPPLAVLTHASHSPGAGTPRHSPPGGTGAVLKGPRAVQGTRRARLE